MIFRDIIKLVVPQNERKAKKEDTAVLKILATAFFKDQTLLTDTAYYLYEKGNYQNYLSEKEDSKSDKDEKARDEESKRRLLNGLLAYPAFCLSIYNALLAPDDDPNIKLQVAAEKDMKEVKVEFNRINLLEKFLGIENFRVGLQTLNEDSDSILHLLVRKDRPHSKILAMLLSHLTDIVNLPNSKGNTPYLDSVNYKKHWAISCFNLSTTNIIKDAKNLQGEDARALAGYDESVQRLISRIQLEPIGLLPANKKFGSGVFYDSYPAFFLSGRNQLSASPSTSSNSITGSSSYSFSSSSSSLLSSPLNSQRSNEPDTDLPSARSDISVESSPDVLHEEPEQIKEELFSWVRKNSVTVYKEFERLLQTDKSAINKSLQAFFAHADLKDKKTLLTDLFALFEQGQFAVEYFNELRQHIQKKYDELQCFNNDSMSKMMFQLVAQLKADDSIRRLTPTALHLMTKQLSGTKEEITREIHLREALFILTSKGNRSKNWQAEFDVILFRVTGLQALYSQREILAGLNSLYSKFDSRQIIAAYLILFQLMIYNPSDFFTQEQLVKEANIFINRGFEKGIKLNFERKRIRSILSTLITANHQFYTNPLIEHFDSLNHWASQRQSGDSFEHLVSEGIKQKDHLLRKSKVHSTGERDLESKFEEKTRLIAQEMRVSMVSFYKQVSLEGLYNYEPPKEEPLKKGKPVHPDSINVSRTINQFNVLNQFFLKKIFDNPEKVLSSLELLLSIGQHLCPLGDERYPDLNHLMVIRGVLSSLPVSRLTRHFQALSASGVSLMKEMTNITDSAKGFAKMTSIAGEYKTTLFFLGRITSQITFAKEIPRESSKGCDLYFMSEFPKSTAQYKNSYIFVKEKDIQEMYYIKPDEYETEYEKIKINDFNLFEENINAIRNSKEDKIHLSEEQVKTIITSNGGHSPIKDNGYKLLEHCDANGKVLLPILKLKTLIRFYSQMSSTDLRQAVLEKPLLVDDDEFYALSKKLQPGSSGTEVEITIETGIELSAFLDRFDEYLKLSHIPVIQSSGKRIEVSETSNFLVNWFQEKIKSMEKELARKQDTLTNCIEDAKELYSHLARTLEKLRQISRLYYRTSPTGTLNFLDKRYNPIEQNNKIKKLLNGFITKTMEASATTSSVISSTVNPVGMEANVENPRENSGGESQRSKRSSGFFRMRLKKEGFILPPAEDCDSANLVFEQS